MGEAAMEEQREQAESQRPLRKRGDLGREGILGFQTQCRIKQGNGCLSVSNNAMFWGFISRLTIYLKIYTLVRNNFFLTTFYSGFLNEFISWVWGMLRSPAH